MARATTPVAPPPDETRKPGLRYCRPPIASAASDPAGLAAASTARRRNWRFSALARPPTGDPPVSPTAPAASAGYRCRFAPGPGQTLDAAAPAARSSRRPPTKPVKPAPANGIRRRPVAPITIRSIPKAANRRPAIPYPAPRSRSAGRWRGVPPSHRRATAHAAAMPPANARRNDAPPARMWMGKKALQSRLG